MKRNIILLIILLCIIPLIHGRAPSVPLPGISDKMDTDKLIRSLVFVERIPIVKLSNENEDYKVENELVKDFRKYAKKLDAASKSLYDFKSPFREMKAVSTVPALDANAGRTAEKQNYKIQIIEIAKPDSFTTDSISKSKMLPKSEFVITIADKDYKIKFVGGSIYQLADAIRKQIDEKITVRLISDTTTTAVMQISTKETGAKNKMSFSGDIKNLKNIGLLQHGKRRSEEIKVDLSTIVPLNNNNILATTTKAILKPANEGEVVLSTKNIKVQRSTSIYFNANIKIYPPKTAIKEIEEDPFPAMIIGQMDGITLSNITVKGAELIPYYVEEKEPPKPLPPVVSNFSQVLTVVFDDNTSMPYAVLSNGLYTFSLSLYNGKTISKIVLKNLNSDRDITISDVKFKTLIDEGGLQPKNRISKARDALISIDGVKVTRPNNNISDVIKGVTLHLKNETQFPVDLEVDHDYDLVVTGILEWVNSYNQVMEYLALFTTPNMDRTPLHQQSEENQRKGLFQTDISFSSLKNRLRITPNNAYKTRYAEELALLDQIGIYTKKPGRFSVEDDVWETAKMGILFADKDIINEKLLSHYDGVAELFAYDTDGDTVYDSGVAVIINKDLMMALGAAGFLKRKLEFNINRMKRNKKRIAKLEADVEDFEFEQRKKFGRMNQAISQSEAQKNMINTRFNNNQ